MKKLIVTALSFVIAMGFVIMVPQDAYADVYTITFTASGNHTLAVDSGVLMIDGKVVKLKDGESTAIGTASMDGSSAKISVDDGPAGVLSYDGDNKFTLFNTNGHVQYDGSAISSNVVFSVEDFVPQYQNIEVNWTFTGTTGEIGINGKYADPRSEAAHRETVIAGAGETDPQKTNVINIHTRFGEKKVTKVTVNNIEYNVQGDTAGETGGTVTVPGAALYTITATGEGPVDRTIIWANPDCKDKGIPADMWITHGKAHIKAVYNEHGDLVPMESYTQRGADRGVIDGYGWAVVEPGSRVVFEFVPEYGYQMTRIAINEMPLDPQAATNEYSFVMPDRNVHFSATFTPVSDVVDPASTRVTSGSISLGNTLEGGTATLTVNDVQLSADKIQGFQNAAGAYNVSQYLDIDLYNVFYKGKNDASDAWENKIDELPNEATISLRLADGVNANDIVLVHNIHDGETFEIIPVDSYDPATNTITFKTKSFSNYAIATKDGKKGGSKGPGTGDDNNIIPDLVIMITAGLALAGIGLKRRYDR